MTEEGQRGKYGEETLRRREAKGTAGGERNGKRTSELTGRAFSSGSRERLARLDDTSETVRLERDPSRCGMIAHMHAWRTTSVHTNDSPFRGGRDTDAESTAPALRVQQLVRHSCTDTV